MNRLHPILLLLAVLSLSSCSLIRKSAVSTAAPLFVEAAPALEGEGDIDFFKASMPANLKLTESLLQSNQSNQNLLLTLTKGYAGYAFAVNETDYLRDFLAEKDQSAHLEKALINYTKAFNYGLRYLNNEGVTFKEIEKAQNNDGIVNYLNKMMPDSDRDLEAVLFTAQSLGSLVNLQRTKMEMIARLSVAKGMFDWVCEKKPEIQNGMCDIFFAVYEAGRPKMLGGNPAKGRELFLAAMKKYPYNWMINATYLQYYLIPMAEEEEYAQLKVTMKTARENFEKHRIWSPSETVDIGPTRVRLYQAIALERFKIVEKLEDDIF